MNEARAKNNIYIYKRLSFANKGRSLLLPNFKIVQDEKTVSSSHNAFLKVFFHYLLTALDCAPPPTTTISTTTTSTLSVMAQMAPLIITQSLSLCTQLPFFLCSFVAIDILGHSECI